MRLFSLYPFFRALYHFGFVSVELRSYKLACYDFASYGSGLSTPLYRHFCIERSHWPTFGHLLDINKLILSYIQPMKD